MSRNSIEKAKKENMEMEPKTTNSGEVNIYNFQN